MPKINKRILLGISMLILGIATLSMGTLALISESIKITGATFNISADAGQAGGGSGGETSTNSSLVFMKDLTGTLNSTNLADDVVGPVFNNINENWTEDYLVKAYNKGSQSLNLVAKADYINDPTTLRDDLYVSIIEWDDLNNNGQVDSGEEGTVYGNDTILRLKNDTFDLGQINPADVKGFIYRFNGFGLSTANANESAVFDFVISGSEVL